MSITSAMNYPIYKEIENSYGPTERFVKKSADAEWESFATTYPMYRDIPTDDGSTKKQVKSAMGADWVDVDEAE